MRRCRAGQVAQRRRLLSFVRRNDSSDSSDNSSSDEGVNVDSDSDSENSNNSRSPSPARSDVSSLVSVGSPVTLSDSDSEQEDNVSVASNHHRDSDSDSILSAASVDRWSSNSDPEDDSNSAPASPTSNSDLDDDDDNSLRSWISNGYESPPASPASSNLSRLDTDLDNLSHIAAVGSSAEDDNDTPPSRPNLLVTPLPSSDAPSPDIVEVSRTMAGGSRPTTGGSSGAGSAVSFECSVCLETLDGPASIDEVGGGAAAAADENNAAPLRASGGNRRGRGGRGGGARASGNRGGAAGGAGPLDVVATHCGHLYHQMCLEKWFTEQGKRTCPSCRKNVPKSKMVRLYRNISAVPRDPNQPGPSHAPAPPLRMTPVGGGGNRDGGEGEGDGGECNKPECQDLKVIHNTLINDYNDLQTRYNDIRENEELKEATIQSLEVDNTRLHEEVQRLKRQIPQETAPQSQRSGNSTKRRRH